MRWQVMLEHSGEEIAVDKNRLNADALVVEQVVVVVVVVVVVMVMVMVMAIAMVMVMVMVMQWIRRGVPCVWLSSTKPRSCGRRRRRQRRLQARLQ
jgi:hypothetical protein